MDNKDTIAQNVTMKHNLHRHGNRNVRFEQEQADNEAAAQNLTAVANLLQADQLTASPCHRSLSHQF